MNYKALWRLRFKRLVMAGAILAGLAMAFLLVEKIRGAAGLNRRVAELRKQGERLAVSDFEPARAKPDEDAVAALLDLTNRLSTASSPWKITPPAGRFVQPGKQVLVTRLDSWSSEKKTNGWGDIESLLAEDGALNAEIHAALQRSGWNDGCEYHNGFIDFKISPLVVWKSLSQRLALSALAALRRDDAETAVARIEDAGRLLKLQTNSPLIICQLVRQASAAIAWNATWEIVTSGTCSEPQLARVQSAWEGMDFNSDMSRAMEMERNMTLEHYNLIVSSGEKRAKALDELADAAEFGLAARPLTRGFMFRHIHVPVWCFSWARQDELRALKRWQDVIEFDRSARAKSWSAVKEGGVKLDDEMEFLVMAMGDEGAPKMNLYDRMRYLCSGMTFSIGSHTTRKSMQIETQRRMLVTAVAIQRWKLRRGRIPDRLDALVPEALPGVPIDLMNNRPLNYQPAGESMGRLYSVGDDGRDDGGDATPVEAKASYGKIWDGRDAVWPSAASIAEANTAAHHK